jgi:hypothetical protein
LFFRPGPHLWDIDVKDTATRTSIVPLSVLAIVTPTTPDWTGQRFSRVRVFSK